ncbi:Uncharacterised protein [Enterobacter hormaechei]|nr:Uncharacterised protein [Enterobacter hormaechei]
MDEHKLFAKGEILQQQLVTAEGAVALRPQPVFLSKTARGEITIQCDPLRLPRQANVQRRLTFCQPEVQAAARHPIFAKIQRQMPEVSLRPVRLCTTGKTHPQERTPVRLRGHNDLLHRERIKRQIPGGAVAADSVFRTDRAGADFQPGGQRFRHFHRRHIRRQHHHRQGRDGTQVVRPQHAHQTFGQLRQVVIYLFAQTSHGEGEALKQPFNIRVRCARLV